MRRGAFTLLEVVIALGVFAVGVVGVLALLPALARESAEAGDGRIARGFPAALHAELRRLADSGGFDSLAARTTTLNPRLTGGLAFVASRSGTEVQSLDYLPPSGERIPEAGHYFLIEVWRFPSPPLAYAAGGAVLPLHVQVSWPHRTPGNAAVVPAAERARFTFNTAISR
ncbi:MAG: hypothetical protein C0502_02180 [Opitutus sp.]|nr:hypothetical protein [Opitutus sp.]